jgi:hypothetical protein
MNPLQQRFQTDPEYIVVMGTTEPTLSSEFHVLDPARRTRQTGQLIGLRTEVLADQVLQDGRQVQVLLVDQLLGFGARLTQVDLTLLVVHNIGQV